MANSIIHDLKTPICVIQCCADLIAAKSDDPAFLELTGMIKKSSMGMMHMTQELLDYARGKTTLEFEELPLGGVLEELNPQVLRMIPPGVQYCKEVHCNPILKVDVRRLVRVLMNLIKNSLEAMHGHGVLRLGASIAGEQLRVEVLDTGCGIPPELQAHVFEPFVTSGKPNGTGLGMAIAKSVVEAHGGVISVHSKVGIGTTMRILLPLFPTEDK